MKTTLDYILKKVINNNEIKYHDIGKKALWYSLNKLIKNNNYKYYHYPNKIDGSRDKHGNWVNTKLLLSNDQIEYEDPENMLFIVFYNNHNSINIIKHMSRNEILTSDMNLSRFYKKSLI